MEKIYIIMYFYAVSSCSNCPSKNSDYCVGECYPTYDVCKSVHSMSADKGQAEALLASLVRGNPSYALEELSVGEEWDVWRSCS